MQVMVHNPTNEQVGVMIHGGLTVWGPGQSVALSEKRAQFAVKECPDLRIGGSGTYSNQDVAAVAKLKKEQLVRFCQTLMRGGAPLVADYAETDANGGDTGEEADEETDPEKGTSAE